MCTFNKADWHFNNLPNHVITATSQNQFKARLDTFWANKRMVHDYQECLTETRNKIIEL